MAGETETREQKIGALTVRIDRAACIGSGNCVRAAGELFDLDDEKLCEFKSGAAATAESRVIEACHVCPVEALIVIDAAGKQIVPEV